MTEQEIKTKQKILEMQLALLSIEQALLQTIGTEKSNRILAFKNTPYDIDDRNYCIKIPERLLRDVFKQIQQTIEKDLKTKEGV